MADDGSGRDVAPVKIINSSRPSRALDHYAECMKQNITALDNEHGTGSPTVLWPTRELEYGFYELGGMEFREEVRRLLGIAEQALEVRICRLRSRDEQMSTDADGSRAPRINLQF